MADIELVIKLPEKIYKHILSMQFYIPGSRNGRSLLEETLEAIRTGTPLPKEHGVLIDGDALRKVFENNGMSWEAGLFDCASPIIEADKERGNDAGV
jgi:hypothetical protein